MLNVQKLYAPDDKANGGAENVVPENKTDIAPQFDPATIDIENPDHLSGLTDEQMTAVADFQKTKSAETGDAPPEGDTAKESEGKPAESADAAPVKYAGKYDTVDDLVKGVTEIAKKVGAPEWAILPAIEAAKELGKYGVVESLYKRMEQELGAKSNQPAPVAAPAKADTAAQDTPDEKLMDAVNQLTLSEIARSPLAQQLAARGLSVPRNVKEFEELVDAQPFFASEFRRVYDETFGKNLVEAQGAVNARREVESANKQAIDTDIASLREDAGKLGFTLTDAEIEAVRAEALAKPYAYDAKFGVKFLRPGAIREHFMATRLAAKLDEIKAAAQTQGRTQAIEDLKKSEKKGISTISTSRLSTKTRESATMPDLSDPAVLAMLPDEALNDPEGYFKRQGIRK